MGIRDSGKYFDYGLRVTSEFLDHLDYLMGLKQYKANMSLKIFI